ncbi:MAG: hypothetical protein QM726_00720 [Chitinophagaceae bacterium]
MRFFRHCLLLLILATHVLTAQRVVYSPIVESRLNEQFIVAGKTGNNYWVQTSRRKRHYASQAEEWMKYNQSFEVYDNRLQLLNNIPAADLTENAIKKYMVCGNRFFDELILIKDRNQVNVQLRRYAADAGLLADSIIAQFPFSEPGNSFILTSSADKSKKLLLGFESIPSSAPRLHAIVFNENWRIISNQIFDHPFITQPFIQDDFFNVPSALNNDPVQIANNGEWLMASPSRTSNNFLLLHFNSNNNNISYKEIIMPSLYKMEDIALSINNEKGEAFAGIISRYKQTSHKNVHVTHYSFAGDGFDFDSSYRFNTLPSIQPKDNTLVKERFIAVPDLGFMLLKEYGRLYNNPFADNNNDNPFDPEILFASNNTAPTYFPINANGYTRYSTANKLKDNCNRGDLSMFYFPGRRTDSCWSGFINKKQITELNAPSLSYLFVPLPDKMIFIYNSSERDDYPFGCTTALDTQGNLVNDREMIAWKNDQSLIMQQSQQITENEVAIPYARNGRKGFAVIRF